MKFISIRELRNSSKKLTSLLNKNHNLVLTSNGKPIALLSPLHEETFEDELSVLARARAMQAAEGIRRQARQRGLDKLSMEQIDQIVSDTRKRRKVSSSRA